MNKQTSKAIILKRMNFGEADKILTLITAENGKLRAIAKGVRKEKSKLAGGLELLSISQVGYIKGRGDLAQIVSSSLIEHFQNIVTDYDRVQLAYKVIEWVDKITEDDDNQQYFDYLAAALKEVNDLGNDLAVVELWARLSLLSVHGNLPNMLHEGNGQKLDQTQTYNFDFDEGCFNPSPTGRFDADRIKVWRILTTNKPSTAQRVRGLADLVGDSNQLLRLFMQNTMHIS